MDGEWENGLWVEAARVGWKERGRLCLTDAAGWWRGGNVGESVSAMSGWEQSSLEEGRGMCECLDGLCLDARIGE